MVGKTFGYPGFDGKGEKVLTRMSDSDPYADMLQTITVYSLAEGQSLSLLMPEDEMAVLLVEGEVEYAWANQKQAVKRKSFLKEKPFCLHAPKNTGVELRALSSSEILVQSTDNGNDFEPVFYTPDTCREEVFGGGEFEGKARRTVRTLFDYQNAPYSNMVCGENIIPQGGWSSYPPHHHPQPEVYYYRFEKPQGFGACFIGDEAHIIKDGSFAAIPGGLCHPQVNAPGYPMYYVWMIRHFDGNPWKDRVFADEHRWLLEKDLTGSYTVL